MTRHETLKQLQERTRDLVNIAYQLLYELELATLHKQNKADRMQTLQQIKLLQDQIFQLIEILEKKNF